MNDSSLKLALREMQADVFSSKAILVIVTVGFVLGLIGPFQSFSQLTLFPRLAYWLIIVTLTFLAGGFGATFARYVAVRRGIGFVGIFTMSWLTAASLVIIVVIFTNFAFFDMHLSNLKHMLPLVAYCYAITFAVLILFHVFDTEKPTSQTAPILKRINISNRAPLVSLSVDDHYVNVTTAKGTEMVLMRLSDAIAETSGTAGLQIHRSYWIALDQVASVTKNNGKTSVVLKNGKAFPISRSYLTAAKAAGIF